MGDLNDSWMAFRANPTEATFAPFYERTRSLVYTICFRILHDEEEAIDALQGVYGRLLGESVEPDFSESIGEHLACLAVREGDRLRKRRVRQSLREIAIEHVARIPDGSPSPRDAAAREEFRRRVESVVHSLPERYALPVLLHYFHGMTHEEVAAALNRPRATVTAQLRRALEQLRPLLEREGLGEAVPALGLIAAGAALLDPPGSLAAGYVFAEALTRVANMAASTGGMAAATSGAALSGLAAVAALLAKAKAVAIVVVVMGGVVAATATFHTLRQPASPPATPLGSPVALGEDGVRSDPLSENGEFIAGKNLENGMIDREKAAGMNADGRSANPLPSSRTPFPDDLSTTASLLLLHGEVTMPDGSPAVGTRLELIELTESGGSSGPIAIFDVPEDGRYEFRTPPALFYTLRTRHEGMATLHVNASDLDTEPPSTPTSIFRCLRKDIRLSPLAEIRGRVVDEEGNPIRFAYVYASITESPDEHSILSFARAEADGTFEIGNLSPAKVYLSAEAEAFVPLFTTANAPTDDLLLHLPRTGATVEGRVYLKPEGMALAGVKVKLNLASQNYYGPLSMGEAWEPTTDATGAFHIERIPPGEFTLSFEKDGLEFLEEESDPTTLVIEGKEVRSGETYYFAPGYRLLGVVRNRRSGGPLEGVEVTASSSLSPSITNAKGEYEIVLRHGALSCSVDLKKEGFTRFQQRRGPVDEKVRILPGVYVTVMDLEMVPSSAVKGRVISDSGDAVAGAEFGILTNRTFLDIQMTWNPVGAEGEFEIPVEPYQTVRIVARAPDFSTAYSDILEILDQPLDGITVTLQPPASIRGSVVDPEGNPVAGARVTAAEAFSSSEVYLHDRWHAVSGDGGEFEIGNLPPRAIQVLAEKSGFARSAPRDFTLVPGGRYDGEQLALRPGHFIGGRIVDTQGLPIAEAHVDASASSLRNFSGNSQTNSDGRYRIVDLVDDRYSVSVISLDHGNAKVEAVDADRSDVDFVLEETKDEYKIDLLGTVVEGDTNTPLTEYKVYAAPFGTVSRNAAHPERFEISGLTGGKTVRVRIEARNRAVLSEEIPVPRDAESFERLFRMEGGIRAEGRVVAGNSGEPVAGVRVMLVEGDSDFSRVTREPLVETLTDLQGHFSLDGAPSGIHTIHLIPEKPFIERKIEASLDSGDVMDLGYVLLMEEATVRGRVIRQPGDRPIDKARVTLVRSSLLGTKGPESERETLTDADGTFQFANVPDSGHLVSIPSLGVERPLWLDGSGKSRDVTIAIGPGVARGRVTLRGKPCAAEVAAMIRRDKSVLQIRTTTNPDGAYRLEGLDTGTVFIRATALAFRNASDSRRIEFKARDGEILADFVLPAGRISGRVLDPEGNPVAQSAVQLAGEWPVAISDNDGDFDMSGVKGGAHRLTAKDPRWGIAESEEIRLPPDGEVTGVLLRFRGAITSAQ